MAVAQPAISPFPDLEFMAKSTEFLDHAVELMRASGPVRVKRMFGGWGIYRDEVFFALVMDDALFLKVDAESAPEFDARGLPPFTFDKPSGETVVTSYRVAPGEALENPAEMTAWARLAYAAALRARATKKRKN